MIITYLGGEFVKVQFGDITLAFNPPAKDSKLKSARFGADVVLVSLNHEDMNGADTLGIGAKQPFIISGPGAYEVKGIAIRGYPTESYYGSGPERISNSEIRTGKINTVYTVLLEGMKLCYLGALGNPNLPTALKEELDDIDILFVPVGDEGVLSGADANKLAAQIEPRLVIPMHYAGLADLAGKQASYGAGAALKGFLKEAGEEKTAPVDKLTLKKKDLEGKEGEIVVLKTAN